MKYFDKSLISYHLGECDKPLMTKLSNSSFTASTMYTSRNDHDMGMLRLHTQPINSLYGAFRAKTTNVNQYVEVSIAMNRVLTFNSST